jgi:hypothetical protein
MIVEFVVRRPDRDEPSSRGGIPHFDGRIVKIEVGCSERRLSGSERGASASFKSY